MSRYKKFLQSRNRFSPEDETEILGHFTRSAKGYFLRVFFGKFFWQCLVFTALSGCLMLSIYKLGGKDDALSFLPFLLLCVGPFIYTVNLIIKTAQWKYVKHVVVTNEGVWTASWSHPLWREKSFDGRRYFFKIDWSLYDWAELSGIFEEQCTISKLYKLKDLIMVRWDGEHVLRFLKPDDFDAIMEYGDKKISKRKRKPRAKKLPAKWWERLFMREE
ncbi:MAG: hypothetical protein K2N33_01730 [Clostridia bacterium]|nr:hypothetical protein [Clostridia bacterium]